MDNIWIGQCYDILYLNQFSLSDREAYPLPSGSTRTGTKEGLAFALNSSNINQWTKKTPVAQTLQTSSNNVINSTSDYERKLKVAIKSNGSYAGYSGSLSTEVNSRVKNSLETRKVTTLTTSTVKTEKVVLLNEDSPTPPPLDSSFKTALWTAATSNSNTDIGKFILKYGTHFSNTVTLGGVGSQSFEFSAENVAELSELGIDTSVQASATIKFVELHGSIDNAVGINKSFLKEIEKQDTEIKTLGGKANSKFADWMASVDSNPVPIEVDLLDHSFFINSNYFPDKTTSELTNAKNAISSALNSYIQSNGRNLGGSVIQPGDQICICAINNNIGTSLPPLLTQPNNPASIQTALKELGPSISPKEFMQDYAKNFPEYVWTITAVESNNKKSNNFFLEDLIILTNLKTQKPMDGEGGNPHRGWVSAAGKNKPLGTAPKTSAVWRINNRLTHFDQSDDIPLNSGDVIALHRVYVDPVAMDPCGYLQTRDNWAFSTGQLYGSNKLIENQMAFQIFKLNQ